MTDIAPPGAGKGFPGRRRGQLGVLEDSLYQS